jgi:NTP pyrophosphatase (non-canonical NTP hydrolase)
MPSKDLDLMIQRLRQLEAETDVNVPRLMTGSDGLASEAGELKEIVKKAIWQGKPLNADTIFHLKRELGDVIFYWIVTCQALNMQPEDVLRENIAKLESRYPGGKFEINHSEVRKAGDL